MAMAQAIECQGCKMGWEQGCYQWISSTKEFDINKCVLITARNVFADKNSQSQK
jgi:hypothetical protein